MRALALVQRVFGLALFLSAIGLATAQEADPGQQSEPDQAADPSQPVDEGQADLDAAFNLKINAKSTRDLDKVANLCETAIEKGLDQEGVQQAHELWSAVLYEHADQLSKRIFGPAGADRRWRVFRREALTRLRKAIELKPELVEGHLLIARLNALEGGERDEARMAIEKAVELAGDDQALLSRALFVRATLASDDDSRLADLNQAIKIDPNNVDAIRVRGVLYLSQDEPEKAIEDFRKWLDADRDNLAAYYVVVDALIRLEEYDQALECLNQAIEVDPDRGQSYKIRSRLYLRQDRIDEALSDVSQAVKLDGRDLEALLLRASILFEREEYDDALDDVNRVLQLQPQLIDGIFLRGMILASKREFAQAIEDIEKLVANDPGDSRYSLQLAMLYNADDRPSKAIKIYDSWIEEHPDSDWQQLEGEVRQLLQNRRAGALRGRADAKLSLGRHQQAIADYQQSLELNPEDDGVLNNLAWVLATSPEDDLRDGQRAIELALKACELTEYKQAHILSTLASGYAEQGDFETAKKWAAKAIEISDDPEQTENLKKELASYEEGKPWREKQNVEQEKQKAQQDADNKAGEQDSPDQEGDKIDKPPDEKPDSARDRDNAQSANDPAGAGGQLDRQQHPEQGDHDRDGDGR